MSCAPRLSPAGLFVFCRNGVSLKQARRRRRAVRCQELLQCSKLKLRLRRRGGGAAGFASLTLRAVRRGCSERRIFAPILPPSFLAWHRPPAALLPPLFFYVHIFFPSRGSALGESHAHNTPSPTFGSPQHRHSPRPRPRRATARAAAPAPAEPSSPTAGFAPRRGGVWTPPRAITFLLGACDELPYP